MAKTKTAASNAKTTKKKAASRKSRASASGSPRKRTSKKSKPKTNRGQEEVTIDRRRDSDPSDEESSSAAPKLERRKKVNRRRQIDPTTCERDYSDAEVEFMNALDDYKRKSGRMFPTCSEVLEVIRDLGYVQLTPAQAAVLAPADEELADDMLADELSTDDETSSLSLDGQDLTQEMHLDTVSV